MQGTIVSLIDIFNEGDVDQNSAPKTGSFENAEHLTDHVRRVFYGCYREVAYPEVSEHDVFSPLLPGSIEDVHAENHVRHVGKDPIEVLCRMAILRL